MKNKLTTFARTNRHRQTDAEQILWSRIRNRQGEGMYFRRQIPIGKYIADFVSREQKVIIEIDGGQHNNDSQRKYDDQRTKCFEQLGYEVIRFWNSEITRNLDGVLEYIHLTLSVQRGKEDIHNER